MVQSLELHRALTAPSCPLFHLKLREWDGIDKPERTTIAILDTNEAMALKKMGYAHFRMDDVEFVEPVGITAKDMLFIVEENRGTYTSKDLHLRLPAKEFVREQPVDWIDPIRSGRDLDNPFWFEYHANLTTEDVPLIRPEQSPWPDNPTEAVAFW